MQYFANRRDKYEARAASLRQDRASWEPAWRDISLQLVPYRTGWFPSDRSRGVIRDRHILNGKPTRAVKSLAAAMMSRITSPGRDWFGLTLDDQDLAKSDVARKYLDILRQRASTALQVSGWYRALGNAVYLDLPSIATSAMFQEEGTGTTPMSFRPMPIGEYFLDVDHAGKIDTCFRDLFLNTRQMVQLFGYSACSQGVRDAWDRSNYSGGWPVWHAVMPNEEYREGAFGARGKGFSSCWWEPGNPVKGAFLRESGYPEFPVLAPRWSAQPEDAYGTGPGWDVRGDCKMLQSIAKARLEMFDKTVRPPLVAPAGTKRASLLPADITHRPRGETGTIEPLMSIAPAALVEGRESQRECEEAISEALYSNLLLMFVNDDRAERQTATEVEAKRTESALQFGPVLENLNEELLSPAVNRTLAILQRNNALPPPPPELQGHEIKPVFISIMHQQQQSTGLVSIHSLVQEITGLAQLIPGVVDKLDGDAIVDDLARIVGVSPDEILSHDKVAQVRAVRAQQEQAQQQGQAMLAATQGARNLSGVDAQKLSDLSGLVSPAAAALGGVQ